MNPIKPPKAHDGARYVTYKRGAKIYPLEACIDDKGLVMSEWELGAEDLARVLRGGMIRLWVNTHGRPFQPVWIETTEPEP